jgi:hypothetical protein
VAFPSGKLTLMQSRYEIYADADGLAVLEYHVQNWRFTTVSKTIFHGGAENLGELLAVEVERVRVV